MSLITNKEFAELAPYDQNYLTWASNVQIVLGAKKLLKTFGMGTVQEPMPTPDENDQAMYFLRHHLCATLKNEHMATKGLLTLWTTLKEWFEKRKNTTLPQAEQEWAHLSGKVVTDKEKIEKTLSTFHLSAMHSTRNHRRMTCKKYDEIINITQMFESHDKVLCKNFISHPSNKSIDLKVDTSSYKNHKPI
ncbi:hypothetical protein DAI22_12g170800 [Oryza sativa Japonica Group]|nr:hypothetical protein DAI22_12g170800 [Oryza sativa Japonica Group]